MSDNTTQVFRIYIDAPAERIWEAITTSELNNQYGYGGNLEIDLRPGGTYRNFATPGMVQMGMPEVVVTGEVVEADPPHRLVLMWDPVWVEEPATRLTWEIEPTGNGSCRVTLTNDLTDAPKTAEMVEGAGPATNEGGGGWPWILSGLKTLLESGRSMSGSGS
ncbi:SRPBCC domain-containing protein [Arsenicicoccus piscis]|uniref:Transcriptional regulator n=1 Tax=Arsenicicoccus piscis TaxID=673954 RepID=A0ABQ6HS26_9MICO|nr:SRPBCC domain-containing protein [Arsenicicoccus piscis]MCH8626625.1 SRPBCC domain-containing protein [Arsenicicoccus piscis]GMA21283.1 transcriptional regulator [Arsenicicoccus piscis]